MASEARAELLKALERIAPYYDLDFAQGSDDIDFYLNFARRTGSPILELGVGTGRVALTLARAGFSVTGLDISPAMLEVARSKLEEETAPRLRLIEADMTHFALEERFALALIPLSGFYHLNNGQEQRRALDSVRQHLQEGGLLIIDVFNPDLAAMVEGEGKLGVEWSRVNPANGRTVTKMSSFTLDRACQLQRLRFYYDEIDAEGVVKRTIATFSLRYLFRYEAELLLECSGFALEALYGNYDLDEFASASPRMLFVARRAE